MIYKRRILDNNFETKFNEKPVSNLYDLFQKKSFSRSNLSKPQILLNIYRTIRKGKLKQFKPLEEDKHNVND